MCLQVAVAIEAAALAGVIGVLVTRRTRIAFALLSRTAWGWIAPAANLVQYAFDAIPKNERWAAQRYGAEWEAYRARTRTFIPYLL
ncbi:MAG: hypothetical protein P8049_10155 [Gemmatimonadota bacterium]|jgi:protein-S-isoprenylcysteine O-methyltransferase Ste14